MSVSTVEVAGSALVALQPITNSGGAIAASAGLTGSQSAARSGIGAVTKVMGFLVLTIGVELVIQGVLAAGVS